MKLSRGSFIVILIALLILLMGVAQVIARSLGGSHTASSSIVLPRAEAAIPISARPA